MDGFLPLSATIETLCDQAKAALPREVPRALALAEEALRLAQENALFGRPLIRAWISRGGARRFAGELEGSKADYEQALTLCQTTPHDDLHASALCGLGIVHRNQAAYRQALACFHQGLELARKSDARATECTLLNGLANAHSILGNHTESVGFYLQALEVARSLGDTQVELVVVGNLGFLFEEMGDFERALVYYEQALSLGERLGDDYFSISVLSNQASSLRQLGRLEEAHAAAQESRRRAQSRGNPLRLAPTLQVQASVLHDLGAFAEALSLIQEAIRIYKEGRSLLHLPEAIRLQGSLQDALGDPEQALASFTEALERAEADSDPKEVAAAHRALAQHFEALAQPAQALQHFKAYHALERQLQRERVQLVLASRLSDLEAERSYKEAELQRLRNGELAELVAALETANRQKEALLEQLAQQALEDPLTGLYNRRYLEEWLPRELAHCQRQNQPLCLALADLDDFKQVNDTFSHEMGDMVLRTVAQLLRSSSRQSDVCVRYGGEELLLVMPNTTCEQAELVCERVRTAIVGHAWSTLHPELQVTVSIGLAASPSRSAQHLLRRADHQLYQAKREGKNRVSH